ncbi:hypothetical protein RB195_002432 [Necator americanus]|uniref:RNAse P Rpr2/Rpp21 subunit domain protein n=1 Tax=Necator americanus TaxID=51031 RepID=A0ABR1DJ07_NECAM
MKGLVYTKVDSNFRLIVAKAEPLNDCATPLHSNDSSSSLKLVQFSEGTMPDVLENGAGPSSSKAPRSSVQPSPNNKRKKGKTAAERREAGTHLHVLDSHVRLNFLHQAAVHLSCQSSGLNDGYAKLSRRYAKLFRDVLKTERVKIMPDIVQTFCKKCKQVFVAKVDRCELKLVQRRLLQRTCLLCGYSKNYEWNMNYLSRNQKFQMVQGSSTTDNSKSA